MKKDYDKANKLIRLEIFNSLRKYLNSELTLDGFEQLSIYLSELNPYIYKKLMPVEIADNNQTYTANRNINASYIPTSDKVSINKFYLIKRLNHLEVVVPSNINLSENEYCAVDFIRLLQTLGHEMKHYFQYKNINNFAFYNNDRYCTYLSKLAYSLIYNNNEPILPATKIDYTMKFFKEHSTDEYFTTLNEKFARDLQYACYLKLFHETDARISSFYFAKGMINTLLNDPLITKYLDVKIMLKTSNKILQTQEKLFSKDENYRDVQCAEEFSSHIMDAFLNNKIDDKKLQEMNPLSLMCIPSMICLSSDTDKIQKVLTLTTETCAPFAMHLFNYATKIFPEQKFDVDLKKFEERITNYYKTNKSTDTDKQNQTEA